MFFCKMSYQCKEPLSLSLEKIEKKVLKIKIGNAYCICTHIPSFVSVEKVQVYSCLFCFGNNHPRYIKIKLKSYSTT